MEVSVQTYCFISDSNDKTSIIKKIDINNHKMIIKFYTWLSKSLLSSLYSAPISILFKSFGLRSLFLRVAEKTKSIHVDNTGNRCFCLVFTTFSIFNVQIRHPSMTPAVGTGLKKTLSQKQHSHSSQESEKSPVILTINTSRMSAMRVLERFSRISNFKYYQLYMCINIISYRPHRQ